MNDLCLDSKGTNDDHRTTSRRSYYSYSTWTQAIFEYIYIPSLTFSNTSLSLDQGIHGGTPNASNDYNTQDSSNATTALDTGIHGSHEYAHECMHFEGPVYDEKQEIATDNNMNCHLKAAAYIIPHDIGFIYYESEENLDWSDGEDDDDEKEDYSFASPKQGNQPDSPYLADDRKASA